MSGDALGDTGHMLGKKSLHYDAKIQILQQQGASALAVQPVTLPKELQEEGTTPHQP